MMRYFSQVEISYAILSGGKKSKRFSPRSGFTEKIFAGEFSRVDSLGVLRQDV